MSFAVRAGKWQDTENSFFYLWIISIRYVRFVFSSEKIEPDYNYSRVCRSDNRDSLDTGKDITNALSMPEEKFDSK